MQIKRYLFKTFHNKTYFLVLRAEIATAMNIQNVMW